MKFKTFLLAFLLASFPAEAATTRNIKAATVSNGSGVFKIPTSTPTASRACVFDGSSVIGSSSVTSAELDFLSGVTSAVQTQINGKEPTITVLASTKGGTGVNNAGTMTWGSDNIAFTTAGATALTLPTSGTVISSTGGTLTGVLLGPNGTAAAPAFQVNVGGSNRAGIYQSSGLMILSNSGADIIRLGTTGIVVPGTAAFGAGAVNNPSFKIDGDATTGMYWVSSGTIGFAGAGVQRARISSTGVEATSGDLIVTTAGKGLKVKEGTNAKMGTATMVAGTVVVATTSVSATSRIFLTTNTPGGTPGAVYVSSRVAGTSFTISSTSVADTSTVAWMIVDPS